MPKSINEAHVAGHVGRDAKRYGNGPYKFSVATGGGKKKGTDQNWPTEWHDIICWDDSAADVKKGVYVDVVGRIQTSEWTDKTTGEKKRNKEIVATTLHFEGMHQGGHVSDEQIAKQDPNEITDEDIPF
jgi:single-stranded DNA-binding protein